MDPLFYSKGRLAILKGRVGRCCCKYCGGQLEIRQIVFNSYEEARMEIFCMQCNRIEYGVEREIYDNACYFVDELCYSGCGQEGADERVRRMNVAKVCDILSWGAQHWGILSDEGFNISISSNGSMVNNGVILEEDDLDE